MVVNRQFEDLIFQLLYTYYCTTYSSQHRFCLILGIRYDSVLCRPLKVWLWLSYVPCIVGTGLEAITLLDNPATLTQRLAHWRWSTVQQRLMSCQGYHNKREQCHNYRVATPGIIQ